VRSRAARRVAGAASLRVRARRAALLRQPRRADPFSRSGQALEYDQQTKSLTTKEDKKIMEDIRRLNSNKPMIKQYDEAQESLRSVKQHHDTLYAQLKAKNAELNERKTEEEGLKQGMEAARAKDDAKRSDLPALYKERETIRKEVKEVRDAIGKVRDVFNAVGRACSGGQ
jgi:uncharacterized coiled-coil DUF342 family protein